MYQVRVRLGDTPVVIAGTLYTHRDSWYTHDSRIVANVIKYLKRVRIENPAVLGFPPVVIGFPLTMICTTPPG